METRTGKARPQEGDGPGALRTDALRTGPAPDGQTADDANRHANHDATPTGLDVHVRQAGPIPLNARFACARGELLAIVGPSGSGKTTLLRAIAGLYRPKGGAIRAQGTAWFDANAGLWLPPQARGVGLVFQDYALFPHMDVAANVMAALPQSLPAMERRAAAHALLARVNLTGLEARRPHALSGGQSQRVALARALARAQSCLLLDEPFSAVDQMTRERLKRELADLRTTMSCPTVLVTHDLSEAMTLADRLCVLARGNTLQVDMPGRVRLRPASAQVARLVGHNNILEGVLRAPAADAQHGMLTWQGHTLSLANTGAHAAGDAVALLVPPEFIVLHRRGRPSQGERENPVDGTVRAVTILGDQSAVRLEVGADTLHFTMPTHAAQRNGLAPGERARVSLLAEGLHLMPRDPR
ncbi:MAG: ABC transporter ATP-binding protein [Pseudomonadota bacterium]